MGLTFLDGCVRMGELGDENMKECKFYKKQFLSKYCELFKSSCYGKACNFHKEFILLNKLLSTFVVVSETCCENNILNFKITLDKKK